MNIEERVDLLTEVVQSLSNKNMGFAVALLCLFSTHGEKNKLSTFMDQALSGMEAQRATELRNEISLFVPYLDGVEEESQTELLINELNSRFNPLKEGMLSLIEEIGRLEARTAAMSLALDSMLQTHRFPRELLDVYQDNMNKMADVLSPNHISFYRDEVQRMQNKIIANL